MTTSICENETLSDASLDSTEIDLICPICLNTMVNRSANLLELGQPDQCAHLFCLDCIIMWAKTSNSCPIDRIQFMHIFVKVAVDGSVIRTINVESCNTLGTLFLSINEIRCAVCDLGDREEILLLCDGCDAAFHCTCLDPPIENIPIEEWYCPRCRPEHDAPNSDSVYVRLIARTILTERVRDAISVSREMDVNDFETQPPTGLRPVRSNRRHSRRLKRSRRLGLNRLSTSSSARSRISNALGIIRNQQRGIPVLESLSLRDGRSARNNAFSSLSITGESHSGTILNAETDYVPVEQRKSLTIEDLKLKMPILPSVKQRPRLPEISEPKSASVNILGSILSSQTELMLPASVVHISPAGVLTTSTALKSGSSENPEHGALQDLNQNERQSNVPRSPTKSQSENSDPYDPFNPTTTPPDSPGAKTNISQEKPLEVKPKRKSRFTDAPVEQPPFFDVSNSAATVSQSISQLPSSSEIKTDFKRQAEQNSSPNRSGRDSSERDSPKRSSSHSRHESSPKQSRNKYKYDEDKQWRIESFDSSRKYDDYDRSRENRNFGRRWENRGRNDRRRGPSWGYNRDNNNRSFRQDRYNNDQDYGSRNFDNRMQNRGVYRNDREKSFSLKSTTPTNSVQEETNSNLSQSQPAIPVFNGAALPSVQQTKNAETSSVLSFPPRGPAPPGMFVPQMSPFIQPGLPPPPLLPPPFFNPRFFRPAENTSNTTVNNMPTQTSNPRIPMLPTGNRMPFPPPPLPTSVSISLPQMSVPSSVMTTISIRPENLVNVPITTNAPANPLDAMKPSPQNVFTDRTILNLQQILKNIQQPNVHTNASLPEPTVIPSFVNGACSVEKPNDLASSPLASVQEILSDAVASVRPSLMTVEASSPQDVDMEDVQQVNPNLPMPPVPPPLPDKDSSDENEFPFSAAELHKKMHKQSSLSKKDFQEKVIEESKTAIRTYYKSKAISKDEYKEILKKTVAKVCKNKHGEVNKAKIKKLIDNYVHHYKAKRHSNKKT